MCVCVRVKLKLNIILEFRTKMRFILQQIDVKCWSDNDWLTKFKSNKSDAIYRLALSSTSSKVIRSIRSSSSSRYIQSVECVIYSEQNLLLNKNESSFIRTSVCIMTVLYIMCSHLSACGVISEVTIGFWSNFGTQEYREIWKAFIQLLKKKNNYI